MTKVLPSAVSKRAPLFLASWTSANLEWQAARSADFVLKDGTTRAGLQSAVDNLNAAIQSVNDNETNGTIVMARRDGLRATTRRQMEMWRDAANYYVGDADVGADLPILPSDHAAIADCIAIFKQANTRWIAINAATDVPNYTPPLVLKDGTTQPDFAAMIVALQTAVDKLNALEDGLPVKRATRDNAASAVYEIFRMYRTGVEAQFPESSPVLETLPTLEAPSTGRTPDAVILSGRLNRESDMGELSWTASRDPALDHYEVKIRASAKYKESDALPLAELSPSVTTFSILPQFLPRGATVTAVVYVVLGDDHQRGSNVVTFVVPV